MSESIIDKDMPDVCYICNKRRETEVHHIFGGPDRKFSEKDGLTVHLCRPCHIMVHSNFEGMMDGLHKIGEQCFVDYYYGGDMEKGMEAFRHRYRKNYL